MAKFKVLRTGETDINSTDIWRFCVHSDYPTQKIYSSGQATVIVPTGEFNGSTTISHSMGYAPMVYAMFENYNGRYSKVVGHSKGNRPIDNEPQLYNVKVDSNNVYLNVDSALTTAAAPFPIEITVYYIIIYDEI